MKGMAETAEVKWPGKCEEYMCLLRCHSEFMDYGLDMFCCTRLKGGMV